MSECCDSSCTSKALVVDNKYRRVLAIGLVINFAMFGVELHGGISAASVSLPGACVAFPDSPGEGSHDGAYGIFVLGQAFLNATTGVHPGPVTMGLIGLLALAAKWRRAISFVRLQRWRCKHALSLAMYSQ